MSKLLMLAVTLAGSVIHAQTVVITPSGESVATGATKQFSAMASGLATAGVTWSAAGVAGGNAANGTINASGLYTAPATAPMQNPVTISALSTADGKTSGSVYVLIVQPAPTITSVSPNPLSGGSYSITVKGSGFIAGSMIFNSGVQVSTTLVDSMTLMASGYQAPSGTAYIQVKSPGMANTPLFPVPIAGSGASGGSSVSKPVVSPVSVALAAGTAQQFSAPGATAWKATLGAITSLGLYTAPASPGVDTVTASNTAGSATAAVTIVSNVPPIVSSSSASPLPLGVFGTTVTGSGFIAQSVAQINGTAQATTYNNPNSLTVTGFAGAGTGAVNLTVANGPVVSQPLVVPVGVANPMVSPAAARRFLEQAAFGPSPADAAHVQAIGFQAWIAEQLAMPQVSNYNAAPPNSPQGMPSIFFANAVTNPDQLRQRVAFALSQIFVTSLQKLINNVNMIPYQNMLLNDAFSSYRTVLEDVTLSPAMGWYLDMANNAKANPQAGSVANENYAREVMQLMSIGEKVLNPDGSPQLDANSQVIPTYFQTDVTEMARIFTGWTYGPSPGRFGAMINPSVPMVAVSGAHDAGSKQLLNGYTAAPGLSPQADLDGVLNYLATHQNTAPFISKQLIEHLVKSNPSPAYVQRVAAAFAQNNGALPAVITAILLDQEARANDEGGADQPSDGHLQEPALYLPGYIRALNGQMTTGNYYANVVASLGEDVFSSPSVFNYFSPGFVIGGSGGLNGPEFQIDNPNAAILRENMVATFFDQYSNPVQSYGTGTTVDLSPFVPLAGKPAVLLDALDLSLTHGTMPAAMKQTILTAISTDSAGSLHQVETGVYLILTSNYYNVWH